MASITDALLSVTDLEWDDLGRIEKVIEDSGSGKLNKTTTYGYSGPNPTAGSQTCASTNPGYLLTEITQEGSPDRIRCLRWDTRDNLVGVDRKNGSHRGAFSLHPNRN